jgi:hypothetical protein
MMRLLLLATIAPWVTPCEMLNSCSGFISVMSCFKEGLSVPGETFTNCDSLISCCREAANFVNSNSDDSASCHESGSYVTYQCQPDDPSKVAIHVALAVGIFIALIVLKNCLFPKKTTTTTRTTTTKATTTKKKVAKPAPTANPINTPAGGFCSSCGAKCPGSFCANCGAKQGL